MPRAVVLLSGGLDSATTLAVAKGQGFDVYALSVDYGQRHRVELDRAAVVAKALGAAEHRTVRLDLRAVGGSALTADVAVPKDRSADQMGHGIPATYVPARNTILLGLALGYAEVVGAFDLFIGANVLDYSGYPDCRPEFLSAFEKLANLATKAGVEGGRFRVHAPLLKMTKAEIIREGVRLGVDYGQTLSCYDPDPAGRACGHCDSCQLRRGGFAEAGVPDPTEYPTGPGAYAPGYMRPPPPGAKTS
ncbi:MAG: 7-cyano-7-deazaguanine synthase QueC [Gemmataceae bacterium]|nr:7-cyano-7-deazaguanine synthase QueC [Gemmataceae bacterium]